MTGKVRQQAWYYHSFDDHNDEAWRGYWIDGGMDFDRDYGYGGFTLYFEPEAKVVGIAICGLKDRFVKRLGRENAVEIARGFQSSNNDWFILCPTLSTSSPWVTIMLKYARYTALDWLAVDYPRSAISIYTPEFRSQGAINARHQMERAGV